MLSFAPFPSISYHLTRKDKKTILTGACLIQINFHLTFACERVEKMPFNAGGCLIEVVLKPQCNSTENKRNGQHSIS